MNSTRTHPRKGSLCLVTRANGFSMGITSSLAMDCSSRGALHRHCSAAPNVDRNEPTITTQGEGQASDATIMWLWMLLPFLSRSTSPMMEAPNSSASVM